MALPEDLSKLRVVDLREELTKRNLPSKGKKDELIARLQKALDQEGASNADDAPMPADAPENAAAEPEETKAPEHVPSAIELEEKAVEEADTAAAPLSDLPQIPVVEEDSTSVQGDTEKEMEHEHEPVITKESGLVDPATAPTEMQLDEERGLKRKGTETDIADQAKRPKAEAATNGQNTTEETSIATEQVTQTAPESQSATAAESASALSQTNAIYIKGFVRPLIQRHAEELAKKYGTVKKFWMDSIKTHCYVIYESSEEASAAHKNIDNIVFPPDTGRTLHVGSITESKADEMIILEKEAAEKRIKFDWELAIKELPSTIPPPSSAAAAAAAPTEAVPEETASSPTARRSRLGGIEQVTKQLQRAVASTGKLTPEVAPKATADGISTSTLRERARAVKVLSLDELFQKTKTQPALYYQPVPKEVSSKRLESLQSKNGAKIIEGEK